MLLPIPEEHAFREDTGGGVLGFFSQEELILAGLDVSNDSVTAEHPCDAEIIAGPAQCDQEQQTWSFPLRHQGRCRAPTATGCGGIADGAQMLQPTYHFPQEPPFVPIAEAWLIQA